MVVIGALMSISSATIICSLAIILGDITNTFDPYSSSDKINDAMLMLLRNILIVGGAAAVASYVYYAFW